MSYSVSTTSPDTSRIAARFGALLGRTANRIADGWFVIDGHVYQLSKNENGSTLHGGAEGFGKKFWSVAEANPR